jgi:hypothetical protein
MILDQFLGALTIAGAIETLQPLIVFVIGMVIYSLFIFKFYHFIARKDVFKLNLAKYNTAEHPFLKKFSRVVLYLIEHVLVFPLLVFFWFGVLSALLAFLSREQTVSQILLVSMALVVAVRITAYYNEDLSKDLAKMLPFALLGVFLVDISFFSLAGAWATIQQFPSYLSVGIYYFLFVIALELLLRIFDLLFGDSSTER